MTRLSKDIRTGRLCNHHREVGDVLHVLTTSTRTLHLITEIQNNADGTKRLIIIGNATIASAIMVRISLDICLFLESVDLQSLGNYQTTSAKSRKRQPHQRQHHQRRKLQLRLHHLRALELRDPVSEPTQLQAPAVTT